MTNKKWLDARNYILSFSILFFFFFDFVTKILVSLTIKPPFFRYGALIKSGFIAILLLLTVKSGLKISKRFFTYALILLFSFVIGLFFLKQDQKPSNLFFDFSYLLRSLYLFVYLALISNINDSNVYIEKWIFVFKYLILINSFFILIGFLFDIELFRSYNRGDRFGYQGFLVYHSEAGYIYFIAVVLFYSFYRETKRKYDLYALLFLITTMSLIGTKKAYLLLLLFFIFTAYDNYKIMLKHKTKILCSLLGFLILGFSAKNYFYRLIIIKFSVLYNVYRDRGFITFFFSYRDNKIKNGIVPFIDENWSIMNYVFGGPIFKIFRPEMELFDIYLFFGIVGIIIYSLFLKDLYLDFKGKYFYLITFGVLLATFFSGNFFASVNVSIIYITCIKYYKNNFYLLSKRGIFENTISK